MLGGSHHVSLCHLVDGQDLVEIVLPGMAGTHHHDHLFRTLVDGLQFTESTAIGFLLLCNESLIGEIAVDDTLELLETTSLCL